MNKVKSEAGKSKDGRNDTKGIWNRAFTSVFIANAAMQMSQQMMNSTISKYADYLGASAHVVGMVVSTFAITAILFKIISGPAIDAFNRRNIQFGALFILAIAYLGYGLSYSVSSLFICRMIQGIGQAFTATCGLALAADALPEKKFASGIGIFSMAQAAAQAIGPSLGLALIDAVGFNRTYFIGSMMMVAAAMLVLQIRLPERERKPFKIRAENIIAKEALLPAGILFLLAGSYCTINSFLIIYAEGKGINSIGLYFTVYALTMLISRPMVGRLVDKWGLVKVIIPAMCCFACSFFLISFANHIFVIIAAAFIGAFGWGACQPAMQTLSMKCVSTDRRGAGSSTNYMGNDFGQLIAPTIAGLIVEKLGYGAMWRFMVLPVAAAAVVVIVSRRKIAQIESDFQNRA